MRIHLHRLFDTPTARVESTDGDLTRVKIDGLVCDQVCASRARQAFSKLAGVRSVAVDFEAGVATVEGIPRAESDYQRALDSVVAGKPVRRFLAAMARRRTDGLRQAGTP
jgi:hypothetical protein